MGQGGGHLADDLRPSKIFDLLFHAQDSLSMRVLSSAGLFVRSTHSIHHQMNRAGVSRHRECASQWFGGTRHSLICEVCNEEAIGLPTEIKNRIRWVIRLMDGSA